MLLFHNNIRALEVTLRPPLSIDQRPIILDAPEKVDGERYYFSRSHCWVPASLTWLGQFGAAVAEPASPA
jgi:hypothetical protein